MVCKGLEALGRANERESRTLVVDHRVVNADGTADWDHCIDDPLNSRRKRIGENEVLRFRIDIQSSGACLLSTPVDAAVQFDSLTTALASARVTAADAEADIEIWMDGLYMFMHQPQGWPRRITH